MSLFIAAHGLGVAKRSPFYKTCHIYPRMIKLDIVVPYLNKIQKATYNS